MMTIEAMKRFGWKSAGIAQRLRQNPTEVKQLVAFRQAIQDVPQFGIRILTIDPTQLDAAAAISQQTGLLSNDALIVAVMQTHGLTNLASADPDFDRVPALTRYAPA
jgi:predicted nucleic acid-binding protein